MMTLDHVGNQVQEAMVHAQLGQQPLALTTETSLQPRQGTRSCLSAQPPALAFLDRDTAPSGDRVPDTLTPRLSRQPPGFDGFESSSHRNAVQ